MKTAARGHNEKTLVRNSNNGNQENETIRQSPICARNPVWWESWLEMSPSTWATLLKCPWATHWHGAAFVPVPRPPCEPIQYYCNLILLWRTVCDWNEDLFADNKRSEYKVLYNIINSRKFGLLLFCFLFWLINWVTSLLLTSLHIWPAVLGLTRLQQQTLIAFKQRD